MNIPRDTRLVRVIRMTLNAEVAIAMMNPNRILRLRSLSALFSLVAATLLSNLSLTHGVSQGVTTCPVPRLPDGESIRAGFLDSEPFPLPSVDGVPGGGNFSTAEYGLVVNGLTIPYTTAAAYGAQYSSGSLVETFQPTRNLPCVTMTLRFPT